MALPTKETLQNAERMIPDATERTLVEYSSKLPQFQMNLETATGGGNQQSSAYNNAMFLTSPVNPTPKLSSSSTFSYSPLDVDTSGRYDRFLLGRDNEDIQGKSQSGWDKAANGLVKGLGIAGTTFLDGTVGLVYGLGSAVSNWSMNKFYNNDFSNYMSDLNKTMENKLPNYYTAAERNANWYEPTNWMTANFFWDKIIKNLGFSAGAMYSGATIGGLLGQVPKLFNISKVGKIAQVADALEAGLKGVPEIERLAKTTDIIGQTSKTVSTLQKLSASDRFIISGLSAATEGGIEALQGLNDFRDKLIAQYQDKYGEYPSEDALNRINNRAEDLGNARFGLNLFLLSATNYIQLPRILGSSYRSGKNTLLNSAETNLETGLLQSSLPTKGIGKALYKAKNVAGLFFSPSEGFEEGMQYAIEKGTNSYYNKKNYVKDESLNTFLTGLSDAAGEGVRAIADKEGMESILIGALSGGIQQAGFVGSYKTAEGKTSFGFGKSGEIAERGFTGYGGELAKNTADLVATAKPFSLKGDKWVADTKAGVTRGVVLQQEFDQHVRIGDVLEAKDTEFDYQHNYLLPRIKYGRFDLVEADINSYKELASSQEGFDALKKKGIASELDTKESFLSRMDNFEQHAKTVNSLNESLNLRYGGYINAKTKERLYSDESIEKMIYAASKISDYDQRVPQLTNKLVASGIVVQDVLDDIIESGIPSETAAKQAIAQIDKLNVIEDVKEELKEDLRDVMELSIRRKDFIDEYASIKANPAKYTSDKGEKPLNPEVGKVTITTQDGEEELEIGTEYYLGKVTEHDKNGNEVYRFPKLTIIGQNTDDTIKIKTSNGNIRDISKAELADYKLGKTIDVANNKTAAYYLAHINDTFQYNFGEGSEEGRKTGRLEYDSKANKLYFVYKNTKGKIVRKQVDNSHFAAQEGFTGGRIKKISTLAAESTEQRTAREAFTSAEEIKKQRETLAKNRDTRLEIITELATEHAEKLEAIDKSLATKKEQLQKVTEDLEELKTFEKKDLSGNTIVRPFNVVLSRTLKAISTLSATKSTLEKEVAELTADKEELEFNLAYFEDFKQNLDELPENSGEFLKELKNQINIIEELRDKTKDNLKSMGSMIQKIEQAIVDFTKLLKDSFAKFDKDYPSYIKDEFESIINKGSALADISSLKAFIADYVLLSDTKKEISLNKDTLAELSDQINEVYKDFLDIQQDYDAKKLILDKFQEVADKYKQMKAEESALKADKELQKAINETADKGVQTIEFDKPYEPTSKKATDKIVPSTTAPVQGYSQKTPLAPHHDRSNQFAVNYYTLPGHENFRGIVVSSGNEESVGIPGLTEHLKNEALNPEDINADKIITLVIVGIDPVTNEQYFVGVNGERLTAPDVNNTIYQVYPENIENMFREDTDDDTKAAVTAELKEWRTSTLKNPTNTAHQIEASFGSPQMDGTLDENGEFVKNKEAKIAVTASNLITEEDIRTKRVIGVPTTDGAVTYGSSTFNNVKGMPLLYTANGLVRLKNRKMNAAEASTVHQVLVKLADNLYKDKNWKSNESKALYNWLKSVVYWGTPTDVEGNRKPAGYNSIFVEDMELIMSEDETIRFDFTPSSVRDNRDLIVLEIQKLYGNVNSTMVTGGKSTEWNKPYVEITGITEDDKIETKTWKNYQSFLLSAVDNEGKERNPNEIPLTTQIRAVTGPEDINRKGAYFTVTDNKLADSGAPELEVKPTVKVVVAPVEGVPAVAAKAPTEFDLTGAENELDIPGLGPVTFTLDLQAYNESDRKLGIGLFADPVTIENMVTKLLANSKVSGITENTPEEEQDKLAINVLKNVVKSAIDKQLDAPKAAEVVAPAVAIAAEAEEVGATTDEIVVINKSLQNKINKIKTEGDTAMSSEYRIKLAKDLEKFQGESWEKVEKWLKANFPNLPVYRVKNMIEATNGRQAWGMLHNGAIYLTQDGEIGTVYHEVFEAVWKMFTSPKEQADIKAEFKGKKGSFIERETGKSIKFSEATDAQIKEQLAEDFRNMTMTGKNIGVVTEGMSKTRKILNEIWEAIKGFFTGDKAQLNTANLFDRIGNGYYKQYIPEEAALSFANAGFIDIDNAAGDAGSEFSLVGFSGEQVHDIMQHMTYTLIKDKFATNEGLFNLADKKESKSATYASLKDEMETVMARNISKIQSLTSDEISDELRQASIQAYENLNAKISQSWNFIQEQHLEYLNAYDIQFDENDNLVQTDENKDGKGNQYDNANKIDVLRKSSSAIKILLASLPVVDVNGNPTLSSIGGNTLIPMSEVFIGVMNNVHTARNIDEMVLDIQEMAKNDIRYKKLYNRITKNGKNIQDLDNEHDIQLLTALWATFKKQAPDVKNVYILENGEIQVGDSNFTTAARQVENEFINDIKKAISNGSKYFRYSEKMNAFVGEGDTIKDVKLDSLRAQVEFMKELGINFDYDRLVKMPEKGLFSTAVNGIRESISKSTKVMSFSGKTLSINKRLYNLAEIKAKMDNPEFSSTYYNVKGELTQTFIGTNAASDLYDALSQISNISELEGTQYEYLLTDTFAKNSVILNLMFDSITGNRIKGSEQYMKTGYADGVVDMETGKQKQSSNLNYKERLMQEINLNLSGYYLNLIPGDASIEWMMYMGNKIKSSDILLNNQAIFDVFKGYFIDELNLSRQQDRQVVEGRNSKDLRFFKNLLGEKTHADIITDKDKAEDVYKTYEKKINAAIEKFLIEERNKLKDTLQKYEIIRLVGNDWSSELVAFEKTEMTEEELNTQLDALNASYAINNIELHKLLYSDPYQYDEELKRIKSFSSPRQAIIHSSAALNTAMQRVWNKGFKEGAIGFTNFERDYFRSATLADVIAIGDLPGYGAWKEGDGGGMISFKAHRNFKIRASQWDSEQEKQYKYDVAWEKQYKFYKKVPNVSLNAQDKKILAKGNPKIKRTYTPVKPIVSGGKLNDNPWNDIILDKFSLYPLSFRVLHEINATSNALKLYDKMSAEDIDYVVFKSARKVGSEFENKGYNTDGSFNDAPFEGVLQVPFAIMSIQSDVPSKEEALVTRGSQVTKMATMDMMEAGVPIDFLHSGSAEMSTKRYDAWYALKTDEERYKASPLFKEIHTNQLLLEELMQVGIENLTNQFDIKKIEGGYELGDIKKVAATLQKELTKREININISAALKGYKTGDVVIEATPAYKQIRSILYSIADREVISPKMPGSQKVQLSSSFLESVRAEESTINGKKGYTSDFLDFYTDEDGKRVCEIMVGRWFKSTKTDEELLSEWYKDGKLTEEGKKILSGVGFRIPTQAMNSIDSFVIKKLLPEEFGDSVIVPSGIVEKVGSDFDIDKLSIYLKNVFVNSKTGAVTSIPYHGMGKIARSKFDNIKDYKKSLENAYIQSLQNLVSHPSNFSKLIKPNSAKVLEDLSKDITKRLTGSETVDYKSVDNMLRRGFMSELRHAFVTGKYAIGIAAVNQTNHSLNQRTTIYIDKARLKDMSYEDKYWLGDAEIRFSKYNTLNIGGNSVATMSMIKNKAGEVISNTLGMFIDGYVDISKGPWIMWLGATPNVASTWMFLVKIGVPIKSVGYFMNQPIIRDYLTQIENSGSTWLFNNTALADTYSKYKGSDKLTVTEIPSESELAELVGKKGLTADQNAQQRFMLNEFLKYAKMAEQMFLMSQGTNYDTASFNDPYLVYKKSIQLEKARNSVFSSADDLLGSSFIGKLSEAILEIRNALATMLKSDQGKIRSVMEEVLEPYTDMNDRDFIKTSQRAVTTLFDWAVQTTKEYNGSVLNSQIQKVLLSEDNVAKQISNFIDTINEDHPLAENQVIKLLKPQFSDKIKGSKVNNLLLTNKGNKVYDQDRIIYAFQELKKYLNSVDNLDLYTKLVTLSVLQSGLTENKLSFTSLLPYEDVVEIYNSVLFDLQDMTNLKSFADLNVFERSYWNFDDIVPNRKAKRTFNWYTNAFDYNKNMEMKEDVTDAIDKGIIPKLLKLNKLAREASHDVFVYTWEEVPKGMKKSEMRAAGDFSYIKKGLFKKIYNGKEAMTLGKDKGESYLYKMINAWGDGTKANEFYTTGQRSIIDNGFEKTNEVDDKKILSYYGTPVVKKAVSLKATEEDPFPC